MGKTRELFNIMKACPFLNTTPEGYQVMYVDGLGTELSSYDFAVMPSEEWARRYTDGGGVKQIDFLLRTREAYSRDDANENIVNIEFFEDLSDWLSHTAFGGGFQKITTLTGGYCFNVDDAGGGDMSAVYQIQCRAFYAA